MITDHNRHMWLYNGNNTLLFPDFTLHWITQTTHVVHNTQNNAQININECSDNFTDNLTMNLSIQRTLSSTIHTPSCKLTRPANSCAWATSDWQSLAECPCTGSSVTVLLYCKQQNKLEVYSSHINISMSVALAHIVPQYVIVKLHHCHI